MLQMKTLLIKVNQVLLLVVLITVILFYGKQFLVPLFLAILFAMLMAPVCRYFDAKKWPRAGSAALCVLILFLAFVTLFFVISLQLYDFTKDVDKISQKMHDTWAGIQSYIEQRFGIAPVKQQEMMDEQVEKMKSSTGGQIGKIAGSITGTVGSLVLSLVFTFLMLLHKEKYQEFFIRVNSQRDPKEVREVLDQITHVSQQYLTGRILSMLFLFILYSVAFMIIGLKNAVLLSAIAAVLTIIPYVGPFLGGFFPLMTAVVSEDSMQPALWVAGALLFVQMLDNYFVEPLVIGGEVRLTALSTIAAIVAGGFIWGVAGMVLFIPMLSVLKIIFDHTDKLKPYGYLVGDEGRSPSEKIKSWFKKNA
jgi:predicted PurR-regulated permease PerM